MSDSTDYLGRLTAFTILALMLVPALAAAVPLPSEQPQDSLDVVDERTLLWWENTNMDLDQDRVHDAIWVAPYSTHYDTSTMLVESVSSSISTTNRMLRMSRCSS